jgi:hypothetical protein
MPSGRDDLLVFLALIAIVVGTIVPAALPAAPAPAVPSAASCGARAPTCAEWTDGCVVCQRGDHGAACSTPGIACVRHAVQCLRKTGG